MKEKYSMRSRTIDVIVKSHASNYTPGPGEYETEWENGAARHSISKYQNSKFGTIDPNLQRFPQIKPSPGPDAYQNEDGGVASGQYTLSRHTARGGRVFSREARFTGTHWRPSVNPGPSNYNVPT